MIFWAGRIVAVQSVPASLMALAPVLAGVALQGGAPWLAVAQD